MNLAPARRLEPDRRRAPSLPRVLVFHAALLLQLVAVLCAIITADPSLEAGVLLFGIGCTFAAAALLALHALRGGLVAKASAAVFVLPTVFVLYESLRRGILYMIF